MNIMYTIRMEDESYVCERYEDNVLSDRFEMKTHFIQTIEHWLLSEGYVEVVGYPVKSNTPILHCYKLQ